MRIIQQIGALYSQSGMQHQHQYKHNVHVSVLYEDNTTSWCIVQPQCYKTKTANIMYRLGYGMRTIKQVCA